MAGLPWPRVAALRSYSAALARYSSALESIAFESMAFESMAFESMAFESMAFESIARVPSVESHRLEHDAAQIASSFKKKRIFLTSDRQNRIVGSQMIGGSSIWPIACIAESILCNRTVMSRSLLPAARLW